MLTSILINNKLLGLLTSENARVRINIILNSYILVFDYPLLYLTVTIRVTKQYCNYGGEDDQYFVIKTLLQNVFVKYLYIYIYKYIILYYYNCYLIPCK